MEFSRLFWSAQTVGIWAFVITQLALPITDMTSVLGRPDSSLLVPASALYGHPEGAWVQEAGGGGGGGGREFLYDTLTLETRSVLMDRRSKKISP